MKLVCGLLLCATVWADTRHAELVVVPLRADGSDPVMWATIMGDGTATGQLVRRGDPDRVIHEMGLSKTQRHISSTTTRVWLLDVDGDGWNDLVELKREHSDVGSIDQSPLVARYDAATGQFVQASALNKKAPRTLPRDDRQLERLAAAATGAKKPERWGAVLDAHSVLLPGPHSDSLLGVGPPFVGSDVFMLFVDRTQKLGGEYHLVHARAFPKREIVSTVKLGPVGFPVTGCQGRREEFRWDGNALVIIWPDNGRRLVEQRVPWNGHQLGKPAAPPVEVFSCMELP